MKKMIGMCVTSCLLLGSMGAVAAQVDKPEAHPIPVPVPIASTPQDSFNGMNYILVVNGKPLQDRSVYSSENELMIPLRSLTEALDYEVTWNQEKKTVELQQAAQWFSLTIGEDRYNVARMLVQLGKAPELKDGRTYVPLSFAEKVLKMGTKVDETGVITISASEDAVQNMLQTDGVITEVKDLESGNKLLHVIGKAITPNGHSSIALNIDDKTEIIDGVTSKPLTAKDIKDNMKVQAFYSPKLTKSLPPQGHAERIVVFQQLGKVTGTVTEIREAKDNTLVHVDGASDNKIENDVVLGFNEETTVLSVDGKTITKEQVKKGDKVTAYYGPIMTMSLPPISNANTVILETK